MLPTPSTSHIDYDRVYEPAEDSYLLLDTLASDAESSFLTRHFSTGPSPLICEVGTGSGVVLAFITSNARAILGRDDVLSLGTDVNRFACRGTTTTVAGAIKETHAAKRLATPLFLGAVNADLSAPLRHAQADVLIFNPPYVPAPLPDPSPLPDDSVALSSGEAFARDSHLLSLSYAGGEEGMEVTNRLLAELPAALSARGVAHVLLCAQNRPLEVIGRIRAWEGGWSAEIVGSSGKKAGWEKLVVLRIWRAGGAGVVDATALM